MELEEFFINELARHTGASIQDVRTSIETLKSNAAPTISGARAEVTHHEVAATFSPTEPSRPLPIWPTEKWKRSPEDFSRKQGAFVAFLRRVWVPAIEANGVPITLKFFQRMDPDACQALKKLVSWTQLPQDIRIYNYEQISQFLAGERVTNVSKSPDGGCVPT